MRPRRIGRTRSVNDGEFVFLKQWCERSKAWMKSEKSIEIDGTISAAATRLWDRDGWTHAVIILLAEWNDNVQTVGGAPLKQDNQLFFFPRKELRRWHAEETRAWC